MISQKLSMKLNGDWRKIRLWSTLWLCWVLALSVSAQDEGGPLVITQHDQFDAFVITQTESFLYFEYTSQTDERESESRPKTKDSDELFRQVFEIDTEAYILHPDYILLDIEGAFEFREQNLDSDSSNSSKSDVSFLTEYDLSGTYRQASQTPLTLFTRRSQTTVDRQFGGSLDNTNTTYGATLDLLYAPNFHHINLLHTEQEQSAISNIGDYTLTQDLFQWQGQVNLNPFEKIDIDYTYDKVDEGGSNRIRRQFDRHNANFAHNISFGDENQNRLRSTVHKYKQTGDFENDRLRWDETLRLEHSKTLSSKYDYDFSRQEQSDFTQNHHRGSAQVRHRLFDSLLTSVRGGGGFLDRDDGFTSQEAFGDITFDYSKRVPYGQLTAQLGVGLQSFDNSDQGVPVQIQGEIHTFVDPTPVRLIQNNIEPGSIVVRSVNMLMTFTEGLDYTIMAFFDHVEIQRVLGGAISNNESVAIDYTIGPEPANRSNTQTNSLNIRYDFQEGPMAGFGLFTRFLDVTEDISTDQPDAFTPNSFQDLTVGLDYRFWRVFLETQYLTHDSTILPSNTFSASANYFQQAGATGRLQLRVNYLNTEFTNDGTETTFLQTAGSLNYQLSPKIFTTMELIWQQQDDRDGIHSEAFEQKLKLNWMHRQTQIYFEFRNSLFNSDITDNTSQRIEIGIQRNF